MSANGEGDVGRTKYQSEQWKGSQRDLRGAIGEVERNSRVNQPVSSAKIRNGSHGRYGKARDAEAD